MIELLIIYEDGRKERFKQAVPFTLGRGVDCEVRLAHWRIARRHLKVTKGVDGYQVDDLGSIYGTRVNGRRLIRHAPILESDEFVVGPCMIRLLPVPAIDEEPLIDNSENIDADAR